MLMYVNSWWHCLRDTMESLGVWPYWRKYILEGGLGEFGDGNGISQFPALSTYFYTSLIIMDSSFLWNDKPK